jgi:hypothetical protein
MTRNEQLAKHVTDLAAAFNVQLQVSRNLHPSDAGAGCLNPGAPVEQRRFFVRIAPVVCDATYAIALHELGHCLSPFGIVTLDHASPTYRATKQPTTLRDVQLQLEEEHAAWDWAHHYALGQEWTAGMASVEKHALETYYRSARAYGVRVRR